MRLPLDLYNKAREKASGGSLKPVIEAGLREAWDMPVVISGEGADTSVSEPTEEIEVTSEMIEARKVG